MASKIFNACFDQDGQVVRKSLELFFKDKDMDFPFYWPYGIGGFFGTNLSLSLVEVIRLTTMTMTRTSLLEGNWGSRAWCHGTMAASFVFTARHFLYL